MKLGEIVEFRKDLYFEGAVQADWFYNPEKANIVAENFVFHGKEYYGVDNNNSIKQKRIDTISLVKNLAQKISDEQSNPLTLAIADYGTGKSHFAVTLATIFSGSDYVPKTYQKVIKNISAIDNESGTQISQLCNEKNFVLVINGMHDFNLNSEILKAAQKSLKIYGLDDSKLKKLNRALNTAELFFDRSSSSLLSLFEKYAKKYEWNETGDALVSKIKNSLLTDEIAFNIVNDAYTEVNGQEIQWDEGISASNVLELLVSEYCGINGKFNKVILLFDEFGRYLEYASNNNSAKSGESALQQIFETAQNSEGLLHIINFIQSDIKTYLQRVDPTSNITRYIGRYDASDKFYISSNLETVFANLIQRKDKKAFNDNVSTWLDDNEQRWKSLFDNLNRWLNTKGMWKNYEQFRKVAVEGIFPMHPISTFMLTQLSDYLQNRSSLTLTSYYISKYAETELDKFNMPIVYPEELMTGDLFKEMYAAESDGRQSTQQCLKYSSVLKKMDGKLDERALTVLRGNLVLRILKFKTKSYDDVLTALSLCTNLQIEIIKNQLKWLVDEYAVLEFDEQSNCFDFMEDSNGAHDYKIYKNRLLKQTNVDKSYVVTNQKILEIANLIEVQTTDFGILNKISTNEWNYKQEIMLAESFSPAKAMGIYSDWKTSITSTEPKGKLVWLYINKDSDINSLSNISSSMKELKNSPTLVMLLKDSDNKLINLLKEYKALLGFDYNSKVKFDKFYKEDLLLTEDKIREQFEVLKKERNVFDSQGNITQLDSRLSVSLRTKFEQIYTNVVPFWFDGFISKNNNIAPTSSKYFCQVVTNLLSGNFNKTIFNNLDVMVRTRIDTLLLTTSRDTSWKCINSDYQVIPPENKNVKQIYNEIITIIEEQGTYSCKALFDIYTMPPYGLSIDVIVLLVAVICANNSYCLRFKLDGQSLTIDYWKDLLIDKVKNKINHDVLRRSYFEYFDSAEVNKRYIKLFERIEKNHDLNSINTLSEELNRLLKSEKLPEELDGRLQYVYKILQTATSDINKWNDFIGSIQTSLIIAAEKKKTKEAIIAVSKIRKSESLIKDVFGEKYDFSEDYQDELKRLNDQGINHIKNNFSEWLEHLNCFSLADMTQFESKCKRYSDTLKEIDLPQYAAKVDQHCNAILADKKEIKSRQELRDDCISFLQKSEIGKYVSYNALVEWSKKGRELQERIKKYTYALGEDTVRITDEIDSRMKQIERNKETIAREIENIWDDLEHIQTQADIRTLDHNIFSVLQKDLPEADKEDFVELQKNLNSIQYDMNTLHVDNLSRKDFNLIKRDLLNKYEDIDYDFDALLVIQNAINSVENQMDFNEETWKKTYLNLDDKSYNKLLWWKEKIQIIPEYLTEQTVSELNKMKIEVEDLLSKFRMEEIIHCFNKLTAEEKKECVEKLSSLL